MNKASTGWLKNFAGDAEATDKFAKHPNHAELLAVGLLGEAGSLLAEVKKGIREGPAYPSLRMKVREEIGDFLWYYVRLVSLLEPKLLEELKSQSRHKTESGTREELDEILEFGAAVGALLAAVHRTRNGAKHNRGAFQKVWTELRRVSEVTRVPLREAARANVLKRANRWPTKPGPLSLFDEGY